MTFSIIQKFKLEGALRIDAEYYQQEYLDVSKKLNETKTITLGEFCRIADGDHSAIPGFVETNGTRYLRAKDLQDFFIDDSDAVFIDKEYFKKIKRSHIKPLDIVLSIMGTVGNIAVVPPKNDIITANRAVAIISPKTQDIFSSYFLAIYLESKYGVSQKNRESMGGVQQRINLDDLFKIKIPILSKENQLEVISIIERATKEKENSILFFKQAEDLLLKELGLKDFKFEDNLFYEVNTSVINERIDTDYYQPKYERLISKLGDKKKLIQLAQRVTKLTKTNPDVNYKYIEIGDVNVSSGEVVFNLIKGKDLPVNAKIKMNGGELIISKVRPTRGAISIIPEEWNENFIASSAFSVFNTSAISKEYIQVVLKSKIGKLQLEKPTTGTSYPIITDTDVENIYIPIIKNTLQLEITELVKKSHEARKMSKELLQEAKRKVEKMIEKK